MGYSDKQFKQPLLPEGCEVWLSTIVTLAVWWILYSNNYPIWVYVPVVVLVFLAIVVALNAWTDADRMRMKAIKMLRDQIQPELSKNIQPYIRQISNQEIAARLRMSAAEVEAIGEELLKAPPGVMLNGMNEVRTEVARLAGVVPEYVDIQDHPGKAGAKFAQQMAEGENGIHGFGDWATDMLVRVNKGDAFKMSTNARLLATLRNLFSAGKSQGRKGD